MKTMLRKTLFLLMITLLFMPACTPTPGTPVACTVGDLIKAINAANATAAADVLELATGCTYNLTAVNTTVASTTDGTTFAYGDVGLPPISTPITINGHNATISRAAGAPDFRIFHIYDPGNLTLNDLTLTNGSAQGEGSAFPGSGGAIYNDGTLSVNRSTLHSNQASFHGGAIFDVGDATTTIKDSTIRDNSAPLGGGIFEYQSKLLLVKNSSILNNTATTEGGGINVGYGSELTVINSVISFNHSGRRGGGIFKDGNSGASMLTDISDSTFEGNTADWGGGAIFIWRTPLRVMSSTFLKNEAGEYGGAIGYQDSGSETINIRGTTFDGNTAGLDGGAIHFSGQLLDIIVSTFRKNTARNGGAIHNAAAELDHYIIRANTSIKINQSTFQENTADVNGGGIYNGGVLAMELCSILRNGATTGGGLYNQGTLAVQDSTFQYNSGSSGGGGLTTLGAAAVIRSTFADNSAARGAGLAALNGQTVLLNDTFSGNSAKEEGGGIFSTNATTQVFASHLSIVHNTAANGGGLAAIGGSSLKIKNSIVALNESGNNCFVASDEVSGFGENLHDDASCPDFTLNVYPLLGALADNGGPTWTHALQPGSPAIDAAPDCTTVAGLAVPLDQRSKTRPGGSFCDLGAYERVEEKVQATAPWTFTPTLVGGVTLTPSPTPLGGLTYTPTLPPLGGLTYTPTLPLPNGVTFTPTMPPLGGVTYTPTLVGPLVTALKNANCRYGPGTAYDIADTLFAGQSAAIVGRNDQSTWWQIRGPKFGSLCWVSQITVQVTGPTNGVPIGVAPPPPTLTPEPRPKPQAQGCYVYNALGRQVCTVPCPPNARPGGACTP